MASFFQRRDEGWKETVVLHKRAMTFDWPSVEEAHPNRVWMGNAGSPRRGKNTQPNRAWMGDGLGWGWMGLSAGSDDAPISSRLPAHPIQTRFGWGWMGFRTGTDGRPKPIQAHPNPFWMGSGWGHRNVFGWVFPADGVVPSSALESPDWRGPPEGQRVTLGRSGCSRSPTLDV